MSKQIAVWFPTVKTNTGTDVFTERLVNGLNKIGIRAEITWLPLRAEYAPWTVPIPQPPKWATIAHVNTWLHSRFLPKQIPVIATLHHSIHDPALQPYKGFARSAYHRWWIAPNERRVMQKADRVVAVSHFAAKIAQEILADVPMNVIYNGVDTTIFRPPVKTGKGHNPFRLVYIGNWKKLKGIDLLAPIMRELGDEFELSYTGGPAAKSERIHPPSNMHDLGRLKGPDEVVAALQSADALLFPSRSEGFPLGAVEAMACGLPVITAQASSMPEVVENNISGMLCPSEDIESLVATCRILRDDIPKYAFMTKAARDRVLKDLTIESMVEKYAELYKSIVAMSREKCVDRS